MGDATGGTVKVAVVGAGSVGATLAYACLIRGVAQQVALYDLNSDKVEAEVLDLRHGLQFVPRADVVGSDDLAVCAGDRVGHRLGKGRGGYLYVLDGELRLGEESLAAGDAAKLAGPEELEVIGVEDAELILIEVPLAFRPIGVWAS